MDEQLDNDLKNRISEVFNNYEDDSADEGWLLLREKFPVKEMPRRIIPAWWYSAAALVLISLGIGLWLNLKVNDEQPKLTAKPNINNQAPKTSNTSPAGQVTEPEQLTALQPDKPLLAYEQPYSSRKTTSLSKIKTEPITVTAIDRTIDSPVINANTIAAATLPVVANIDSAKKANVITDQTQQAPIIAQQTTPVVTKDAAQKMQDLLSNPVINKQTDKSDKADKKVMFGVYAATYFNYAKGSTNELNVGAGFSSDFRLSKNLKFSTGVAIAQNSFKYSDQLPPGRTGDMMAAAAPAAPVTTSAGFATNAGFTSATISPTFKGLDANLLALDIPINFKFEFNPEKNDTYISAGLSSGTFLNEKYRSVYSYVSPFSVLNKEEQATTTTENFNNFYFAKTLNLSFGIGYPVGKSNRLVIEPFMKYPLSGLGAQQIKFGSGGVNLKFNFSAKKK